MITLQTLHTAKESARQSVIEKHCSGCWVYEERNLRSEITGGVWSFEVCQLGCTREDDRRMARNNLLKNIRYHKNHPGAKYRTQIPER